MQGVCRSLIIEFKPFNSNPINFGMPESRFKIQLNTRLASELTCLFISTIYCVIFKEQFLRMSIHPVFFISNKNFSEGFKLLNYGPF